MASMRAKMRISKVETWVDTQVEKLHFVAVGKSAAYPPSGYDEDNTYANYTPQGEMSLTIANPDLQGKFKEGDKYYIDFTQVEAEPSNPAKMTGRW